jgi:hypothetical protein
LYDAFGDGTQPESARAASHLRKLKVKESTRVWRIECHAGEEAQVDFGLGAPIVDEQRKRTRTWVLHVVLSHSRKGNSEAVLRQETETFLRVLENAIGSFGGAPLTLNVDNLKAAPTGMIRRSTRSWRSFAGTMA